MTYYPPWQRRQSARPKPAPREPTLSELALSEMMQGEPEAPFGGWGGEFTSSAPVEPLPAPQPMIIPPPDWEAERRERERREAGPDPGTLEEQPAPHPPPTRGAA